MEALQILNRSEMKNLMAGSGCEYSGCSGASADYNCWYAECASRYYGSSDAIRCANQVGASHKLALTICGANYS